MGESTSGTLITRLVPILYVRDIVAERRFYEQLGLAVTYEGPEYPDFIAVGNENIEFGLSTREDAEGADAARVLTWQLGVTDIDAAMVICERAGIAFELETHEPGEGWQYRTLHVRTPNGMAVVLEGPNE
jgi:catechol 2,3-dioxygenase-like lactoylglutathione lyase family enzyme